MALGELRGRLTRSLEKMEDTKCIFTLNNFLSEIRCALLDAGFPILPVNEIERKISKIINPSNNRSLIYQIISGELSRVLDPGNSALIQPCGSSPTIVMFISLKDVAKTDLCAKYALYHRKKGFRPALVSVDTFRADAFHRLNKAANDEVPVYGSFTQDPAKIATEGIEKFTKEKRNLIIVDTSARHLQFSALFKEMHQLAHTMKPNVVIFVMDCSIGQAAFDQARAFKEAFPFGFVMLANLNDISKPAGALTAVAAAKCPMILAETGEERKGFEAFNAECFIRNLLYHREYTLRKMYESYQFDLILHSQGFLDFPLVKRAASGPHGHQNLEKMRRYMTIMDSMTDEELDQPSLRQMSEKRVMEIAEGSKVEVRDVMSMLKTYKRTTKRWMEMMEKSLNRIERNIPRQVGSTSGQITSNTISFDPLSLLNKRSG